MNYMFMNYMFINSFLKGKGNIKTMQPHWPKSSLESKFKSYFKYSIFLMWNNSCKVVSRGCEECNTAITRTLT